MSHGPDLGSTRVRGWFARVGLSAVIILSCKVGKASGFIGRVRKKIGSDRIETVRGLGYRLTCPDEELGGEAQAS